MSSSGIKAGQAYVRLLLEDHLPKGLANAQRRLATWAKGLAITGGSIQALGASVLTPLLGAANVFANQGSALNDMNAATGVSVEELSALKYAAEQCGGSVEGLQGGLRGLAKFTQQVHVGSKQAKQTLSDLGISVGAFTSATPTQRLMLLADGLKKIADPSLRAAAAMKVLGKGGAELMSMLAGGSGGIQSMVNEANKLGLVITGDEAAKADELGDAWDKVKAQFTQVAFVAGAALADSLLTIFNLVSTGATAIIDFVRSNQALVLTAATLAVTLLAVGGAFLMLAGVGFIASGVMAGLSAIVGIATGLWTALGVVKTVLAAINTWMTATLTAEGLAALFASIKTTLLSGAMSLLTIATSAAGAALSFLISPLGIILLVVAALTTGLIAGAILFFGYTEAGRTMGSILTQTFWDLLATARQTFGGIFDAIIAGNWGLAGQIAMAGLRLAWFQGVVAAMNIWQGFKEWMMGLFAGMFEGIAKMLADSLQGWVNLINLARQQMGMDDIEVNFIQKIREVGEKGANAMRENAARERAVVAGLGKSAIAGEQAKLDQLTAQAKKLRTDQADARRKNIQDRLNLSLDFPGNDPVNKPGASTLGTFSAAVAGLLGRSGVDSTAERTASATEKSAEHLEEIKDKIAEGGFEWE